ncbi:MULTISPECIES: polysaccharide deacetylase family protein [Paenibacillus]|uniref:Polysaccharide deacetylase family protein n=1 Tax=Paenibacillus campinasensis TaxID=66347 RepID=A0A268F2V6_9BACL|nr:MULTISPECIES: polysaccharide deacetylase family protein [Paenibacillus]MUG64974.1 polysaccharide deacetylase family protein [Paenibacillus campinasensis]PAD79692.1 xylanase deacetylase [Paenibacillus campinasensis]PAK53555.1 xylanase deacetylase [Paenibacillus sp. 7541]
MGMKSSVLLLAACLLLTACGADSGKGSAPAPSPEAQQEQSSPGQMEKEKELNMNVNQDAASKEQMQNPSEPNEMQEAEQQPADPAPPGSEIASIQPQYHMNSVYRIVPNEESVPANTVLLTFDDGPKDEALIHRMIDILDKHDAKAIFFVNGYRVKANPELLRLIHERGQIIGNHSWDHIDLKKESPEVVRQQIVDVQNIVEETIGEKPKFFRPPFGSGGDAVKAIVEENGMLYMTWSNGSLDWESKYKNKPEAIIQNVLDQLHPGSNILMHELPWTADALDGLLTELEQQGYHFVHPESIELTIR